MLRLFSVLRTHKLTIRRALLYNGGLEVDSVGSACFYSWLQCGYEPSSLAARTRGFHSSGFAAIRALDEWLAQGLSVDDAFDMVDEYEGKGPFKVVDDIERKKKKRKRKGKQAKKEGPEAEATKPRMEEDLKQNQVNTQ